jgi:hypothetical protein
LERIAKSRLFVPTGCLASTQRNFSTCM